MMACSSGKCIFPDCGLGDAHDEIQATRDMCLNGMTLLKGQRMQISSVIRKKLPQGDFTVNKGSV